MSTLAEIDTSKPVDTEKLKDMAARILETRAATVGTVAVEHNLTGEHKIPEVTSDVLEGMTPVSTGQLVIVNNDNTTPYLVASLGFDSGWHLMDNPGVGEVRTNLQDHINATPINHEDGSITEPKFANGSVSGRVIQPGALQVMHFVGGSDTAGVSSLADGSVCELHTHDYSSIVSSSNGITFYNQVFFTEAEGVGPAITAGVWTTHTFTKADYGLGANPIGVILNLSAGYTYKDDALYPPSPYQYIEFVVRKNVSMASPSYYEALYMDTPFVPNTSDLFGISIHETSFIICPLDNSGSESTVDYLYTMITDETGPILNLGTLTVNLIGFVMPATTS